MKPPKPRQTGKHLFADCGDFPSCVTCGCSEDEAYVGGIECSFQEGDDVNDQAKRMREALNTILNKAEIAKDNPRRLTDAMFDIIELATSALLEAGYTEEPPASAQEELPTIAFKKAQLPKPWSTLKEIVKEDVE